VSEFAKTMLSSGVIAGLCSAVVSWLTISYKIDLERYSRQAESGYDQLVEANSLRRRSRLRLDKAMRSNNSEMIKQAEDDDDKAQALYDKALGKIAVYGSPNVVRALSSYLSEYYAELCYDPVKFEADIQVYKGMRDSLGRSGNVSANDLLPLLSQCKNPATQRPMKSGVKQQ
jgi:hypothetical protein